MYWGRGQPCRVVRQVLFRQPAYVVTLIAVKKEKAAGKNRSVSANDTQHEFVVDGVFLAAKEKDAADLGSLLEMTMKGKKPEKIEDGSKEWGNDD